MKVLVMNPGNQASYKITIMLTPQDGGENKVREKIKKMLITRISD